MRFLTFCSVLSAISTAALAPAAANVTSPESRQQTLLEYIKARDDLSADEKAVWEKTLRLEFGGKALKPADEAVTAAKSVISAGIFFRLEPKKVAKAAYEAHNDVLSWVPAPVAIDYQLLTLQGRRPKESSRLIAFNFPKYFNEDLAPEYVNWWGDMLERGEVNPHMLPTVERQVAETRVLMRPMLRERLWAGVEMEARLAALKEADADPRSIQEVEKAMTQLATELRSDFRKVSGVVNAEDESLGYFERYQKVSDELKKPAQPRPQFAFARRPKPRVPEPVKPVAPPTSPPVTTKPGLKPTTQTPKKPTPNDQMLGPVPTPAPMPGEPFIAVSANFGTAFEQAVDGWAGTPYLFGGESRKGIDCSAFTRQVFRESTAVELPRTSGLQYNTGAPLDPDGLMKGDIVFFDTLERGRITHVGVYMGEGQFAHASSSRGVTRDQFRAKWAQRAYRGARRIMDNH